MPLFRDEEEFCNGLYMRLLVITQFSALGGSSRIQVIQFFPFLEKAGIAYRHRTVYADRFYLVQNGIEPVSRIAKKMNFFGGMLGGFFKKACWVFAAGRFDAVLIQREVFPRSWYWLMRRLNPRIIYEIEDTIFEMNPFWRRGGLHDAALRYQAAMCRNMMRHAAHVIAENEYLAAEARRHNRNVSLLTAPINTDIFAPAPQQGSGTAEKIGAAEIAISATGHALDGGQHRQRDITIGWIGSPGTSYMLKNLEPVFTALARRHPEAVLKAIGVAPDFRIAGIGFLAKGWSAQEELADLRSFDIGIMPLDDTPFNRGRLGYKIIQYMAVGIPIVASDVGLNRTVVEDGKNGFLVKTPEEWVEKLSPLISDASLRRRMGEVGRKMAEERFSLRGQSGHLIETIHMVCNR